MAFHRSLGVISRESLALGFGVGGASIRGECLILLLPPPPPRFGVESAFGIGGASIRGECLILLLPSPPPPRFGVEYTWRRLLSELGPGVLLVPPSRLDLGVEGATIEEAADGFAGIASRLAFCVGYFCL